MAFKDIFKDTNDYNEKTIIGFIAFLMMVIAMAVDLVDEEGSYKMWYSEDNNDVRFRVAFKMGVNVAFTNECVSFVAAI
jgi:hypothetical protein